MPVLESIEQRLLFRLTRFVAFIIVLVLTIGLVVGAILFLNDFLPNQEAHLTYSTIYSELHAQKPTTDVPATEEAPQVATEDTLKLPFVLQPLFSTTENRNVLKKHMADLDSDEREEYLSNLAEVVTQAKAQGDDTTAVVNQYFEDKEGKIALAKLDRSSRLERQLYVAAAAVSIVLLIAFASLILVLLAIERNTRPRLNIENTI
jgi:hypothetical protein